MSTLVVSRAAINDLCFSISASLPRGLSLFDIDPRPAGTIFFFKGPEGKDTIQLKGTNSLAARFKTRLADMFPELFKEATVAKDKKGGKGLDASDRAELKKMGKAAFVKHEKADIKAASKKKGK